MSAAGWVVRYRPEGGAHCREGMAVSDENGAYFDTFWGSGSDRHRLNAAEVETIEPLFDIADFDELDQYSRSSKDKWKTYAEEDRAYISSQHRLQFRWFIRKGAIPSRATLIANAHQVVEDAESRLRSAESALRWAREDLDALRLAPDDCTCRPSLCTKGECVACAPLDDWRGCKALPARLAGSR